MPFIYKIINNVNNKVYVGQTSNIRKRKNSHYSKLKYNKHYNKHLQSAWNKYGSESFTFEIIEQFDSEMNFDINNLEKYWIKKYESNNPDKGYNLSDGGVGLLNPSNETREKMSRAWTAERRRVWSKMLKCREVTEETRKKQSEVRKGKYIGDKHPQWGKPSSRRREVICLNNNKVYQSTLHAQSELGVQASKVTQVCKGKRKATKGYFFEYYERLS